MIWGSDEDKSGTFLRPMMTKSRPKQDTTENLKTEIRQKGDIGQKQDIIETEAGQNVDSGQLEGNALIDLRHGF